MGHYDKQRENDKKPQYLRLPDIDTILRNILDRLDKLEKKNEDK